LGTAAELFRKPVTRKHVLQDQQIGAPDHARLHNVLPGDDFIFGAAHPARHQSHYGISDVTRATGAGNACARIPFA
jgi:hypothetical protein